MGCWNSKEKEKVKNKLPHLQNVLKEHYLHLAGWSIFALCSTVRRNYANCPSGGAMSKGSNLITQSLISATTGLFKMKVVCKMCFGTVLCLYWPQGHSGLNPDFKIDNMLNPRAVCLWLSSITALFSPLSTLYSNIYFKLMCYLRLLWCWWTWQITYIYNTQYPDWNIIIGTI